VDVVPAAALPLLLPLPMLLPLPAVLPMLLPLPILLLPLPILLLPLPMLLPLPGEVEALDEPVSVDWPLAVDDVDEASPVLGVVLDWLPMSLRVELHAPSASATRPTSNAFC
jgi:hypothetical protein